MCLPKSVTQYQIDFFSQADMLRDHSTRVYANFKKHKEDFESTGSEAAKELALSAGATFKLINDVSKGVCAALCIKWIKMVAVHKRAPMAKLKMDTSFAKAVIRQQAANLLGLQQEQLAQSYKLKANKKELNFSRALSLMVSDIVSVPGLFYLMSFITSTGSHVIAISSEDCKRLVIFDPNFGEFGVPAKQVTSFLTDLLQHGYAADTKQINGLSQWSFA